MNGSGFIGAHVAGATPVSRIMSQSASMLDQTERLAKAVEEMCSRLSIVLQPATPCASGVNVGPPSPPKSEHLNHLEDIYLRNDSSIARIRDIMARLDV